MRNLGVLISAAMVTAIAPTHASATDYWAVGIATNRSFAEFMDADAVGASGGGAKAWVVGVYREIQKDGTAYYIQLNQYNCQEKQYALLTVTTYDQNGNVIGSSNSPYPTYNYAIPGSIGSGEVDFVCFSQRDQAFDTKFDSITDLVSKARSALTSPSHANSTPSNSTASRTGKNVPKYYQTPRR